MAFAHVFTMTDAACRVLDTQRLLREVDLKIVQNGGCQWEFEFYH